MDSNSGTISDSNGTTLLGQYGRGFREVPALPIGRNGKVQIEGKCPESSYDLYFLSWWQVLNCVLLYSSQLSLSGNIEYAVAEAKNWKKERKNKI